MLAAKYASEGKKLDKNMYSSAELAGQYISSMIKTYKSASELVGNDINLKKSDMSDETKLAIINGYVEQFGFVSGNILDKDGISIKDGTDFSDREYVMLALKGEVNVSDINLSKYTNTYGFSVAAPLCGDNNEILGVVYFRVDVDYMKWITDTIKVGDEGA